TAVGEGVGCDVHDPHDQTPAPVGQARNCVFRPHGDHPTCMGKGTGDVPPLPFRSVLRSTCTPYSAPVQDQAHRLGPSTVTGPENTSYRRGDRLRTGLAYPTHGHAQVFGLHHDDDSARIQIVHERVGDLSRETFLHLRTARVHVDETGKLAQPGDPPVGTRDVTHVRHTVQRHH